MCPSFNPDTFFGTFTCTYRMAQAFLWRAEIAKCVGACCGEEGRGKKGSFLHNHTLPSLWWHLAPPSPPPLPSSPSLPPSVWGSVHFSQMICNNNGVPSCSRSQSFQVLRRALSSADTRLELCHIQGFVILP